MAQVRDKSGRPIVVVTGMGIVTSLGAGKTDNWKKLAAGQSGIRAITRFPTEQSEDPDRRHRRFRAGRAVQRPALGRASRRDRDRGGHRRSRRSAAAAHFPGPLFLAVAPIEIEWPQREELARASGRERRDHLRRPDPRRRERDASAHYHDRFMFGSVAEHLADKFGTAGLADFAVDRLRLRRERDPARRRGDPPRRDRCGAVRRHRRLGQSGKPDPLLAAVGALDPERSAGSAPRSRSPRTATASSWRKAPARWCSRATRRRRRAAPRSSASCRAAANSPTRSIARARVPTASRSSAACATRLPMPASSPDDIDYINAHGTSTPENDKMECVGADRGVRRARQAGADLVQQIDDRSHAVGGRRGRGGLHVPDAASISASRRPSTTTFPIRRFRSTSFRTSRATPSVRHAISNSFGFGGQNVSLVMSREPA